MHLSGLPLFLMFTNDIDNKVDMSSSANGASESHQQAGGLVSGKADYF